MKPSKISTIQKYSPKGIVCAFFLLMICFWNSLPYPLFAPTYSEVIYDSSGQLLNVTIANDQQWRFVPGTSLPAKYSQALVLFEDERFYSHLGVDLPSVARAIFQNIAGNRTVSGASTISMQTIRMARGNKKRTYAEKILEMILAVRLEMGCSKKQILSLYAHHAPFGGNIVGIEAASWKYFGHSPNELSWAEAAMLAVLPNSPSLIRLDRNSDKLTAKRNRLLQKLLLNKVIDSLSFTLAITEPLPNDFSSFPQDCPLLPLTKKSSPSFHSSINKSIQQKLNNTLIKHYKKHLKGNNTQNACAVIIENRTNRIVAYAGNILNHALPVENRYVDIAHSPRSTGSILKPFLYAGLLTDGAILPHTLIADVPTAFKSFAPKNYNKGYEGAVPANTALARSLNVPAVYMLQQYGNERFLYLLQKAGMTSLSESASHYGLSLILGGCEGKLLEIASVYSNMARNLTAYTENSSRYFSDTYEKPHFENNYHATNKFCKSSLISAAAIYYTFQALINVERPEDQSSWENFKSSEKIAWKTGTSFGFRDAWAVGVTPKYTVGVWTGNADGEGYPAIIGVKSSAPILFDIFNFLPRSEKWFDMPYDDMIEVKVCKQSGMLASRHCPRTQKEQVPSLSESSKLCPFHQSILLDAERQFRIKRGCYMKAPVDSSWFILPAHWAYYYAKKHAFYKALPAYHPSCADAHDQTNRQPIKIIYPYYNSKIYIPTELKGDKSKTVFEAFHIRPDAILFWYIDNTFFKSTTETHKIAIAPAPGKHVLQITDDAGNSIKRVFEITSQE